MHTEMRNEHLEHTSVPQFLAIVLVVAGFAAGLGIMFFGAQSDPRSAAFAASYSGRVWILLIAAQVSFWAVVAMPLWSGLRSFRSHFPHELHGSLLQSIVFACVLVALLGLAPLSLPHIDDPLAHHSVKIGLISAMGVLVVGVPALLGMFWIRIVAASIDLQVPSSAGGDFGYLRDALQRLLRLTGATIALSTLSTGALQQALVENSAFVRSFPSQLVLLWGAGATVILMLAYVPAYLNLRGLGNALIDRLLPMPGLGSDAWFKWDLRRRSLSSYLQLDQNLLDRLESGILILAPLISAAISVAIPT